MNRKRHSNSFHFNIHNIKNKNLKKRNSIVGSPTRNKLILKGNNEELKRFKTNELKIDSDIEQSQLGELCKNDKSNGKSLKFIEKNIKNKILDISMKIEKEENITSVIKENNLNLSILVLKQIEGDYGYNGKKLKSKTFKNDLNISNSKINLISNVKIHNLKADKYRVLLQKNILYDSLNSEEDKENEDDGFYISPKSKFVLIFDFLIIIFCLFDIIYTPYNLSKINSFCDKNNNIINYIYFFIDILYIFDLLLGFVRSYYNFQFTIIKNQSRIIKHYLVTQFWFDFFAAFPIFTYISFICKKQKSIHCGAYDFNNRQMFLLLSCFIKQIKLFKITDLKKNSIMLKIDESISEQEFLETIVNKCINTGICIFCFYIFISIHIFIGRHSYPNWITKNGFDNQSHFLLYLTSFYYLITTMTTVGYGDIVVATFSETVFQIIVLSVGITVYSWIVSNIGNYVKNESYASMIFNKDGTILEEIRISYPNMPFRLYKQILHHLNARKIRQKHCDSNLLINSLPYSLKNSILLAIYKQTINGLKIFKGCKNSDFIVRLLTSFIPLFSKKNAILIHEGQLIENIIFVKYGRLALQAAIDIEEPEESIKNYLHKNFGEMSDDFMLLTKYESSNTTNASLFESRGVQTPMDIARTVLDSVVNTKTKSVLTSEINESRIGKEMGKWDYGGEDFEESNYQFLNIINLSKNESYGVVYMFFTKPSPLSLRVKSRKVELLLLRKTDVLDISQRYPNIWMKYLRKSFYNILSIKQIAVNKIKYYWENLEKQKKTKKPIVKSKSYLNPISIYKLKNFEHETFTTMKDQLKTKLRVKKSKSLGLIKLQKIRENKLPLNNKRNSYLCSTNFSNQYSPPHLNKKNILDENNIKNNNNYSSRSQKEEIKPRVSKFCSNGDSQVKNEKRKNRKSNTINKLKIEIKKLKNSRNYYKKLCQQINKSKEDDNTNYHKLSKSLLKTLKKYNTSLNANQNQNQNQNIFQSVKPNIINNITIKNNNKFLFNSNYNDNSIDESESQSFKTEKSSKKFIFEDIRINSEINLFFKAKYINLEKYTGGAFSKNEELRKQSLNFIKVFLEIEKKKNKKLQNTYIINNHNNKKENPYLINYDFRYILNKINLTAKRKSSFLNNNKSNIYNKNKKGRNSILTSHSENRHNNSCLTSHKEKSSKKYGKNSITKSNNLKKKFRRSKENELSEIKQIFKNNSMIETQDKKDIGFLQLPLKIKTIKEWDNENENESVLNKQTNEDEISNFKSLKTFNNKIDILSNRNKSDISLLSSNKSGKNIFNVNLKTLSDVSVNKK